MKPAILLVDDDVFLLIVTAELLSDLGYPVTTARNGSEALAVLDHGHAVDLLVTDVQMPDLNGLELARRAKAIKPTLAVLYCTGHPELIDEDTGPTLGPILSKPFPIEQLHREITRVHQAQASSRGNVL
jgi:CheY-like chemotaxis protein